MTDLVPGRIRFRVIDDNFPRLEWVMGRPELGSKCVCVSCAERFYDLKRVPATCPKCGTQQPPEKPRVFRPSRSTVEFRRQPRQPVPVATEEDVEPAIISDTEDEEDVPEVDEEIDEDIEIIPDHGEAPA
jgi:uncharacterized protein (TIGR02300 family)